MVNIETTIEGALKDRLQLLSVTPPLAVAWDNQNFKPPATGRYLIQQLARNGAERRFIASDGPHRYQGLFMLTLMSPLGTKAIESTKVADQIVDHFPCDLMLEKNGLSVRITKRPDVKAGYKDEKATRWRIPIVIEYECWA